MKKKDGLLTVLSWEVALENPRTYFPQKTLEALTLFVSSQGKSNSSRSKQIVLQHKDPTVISLHGMQVVTLKSKDSRGTTERDGLCTSFTKMEK